MNNRDMIAIVWAPFEARTAMIASQLDIPLFNIHYLQYKRPLVAPIKYVAQWLKTWLVLIQQHPRFVYVTNPPVVAVLCVFMYCRFTRTRYIMDTHPPALYMPKWAWTRPLQRFLARYAYLNITDQEKFKLLFESWSARTTILENKPKEVPYTSLKSSIDPAQYTITVVNTFAADEPLEIILDAARQLPDVYFFILGDTARAKRMWLTNCPKNVVFTGYLRGDAYWGQLYGSRAVMVLTTFPDSLLGGAQDGIVVHKPLILSRQPALIEYFTKGAIFVENSVEGLIEGVHAIQQREQDLTREIDELSEEKEKQWDRNFQRFIAYIQNPDPVLS